VKPAVKLVVAESLLALLDKFVSQLDSFLVLVLVEQELYKAPC